MNRRLALPRLFLAASAALAIAGPSMAQAPVRPMTMDEMNQFVADIPGAQFSRANRIKAEILQAAFAGADLPALEPRLIAFAEEYAKAAGVDPKPAREHALEVGAQLVALGKDPAMRTHMGTIQGQ